MQAQPLLPQFVKASGHQFGFGIKIYKQQLLPRIKSNTQIKRKQSSESVPLIAKNRPKINSALGEHREHIHTQHNRIIQSPHKVLLTLQKQKSDKQKIISFHKCRIKIRRQADKGQKYSQRIFANPSVQLPIKSQRLEKLVETFDPVKRKARRHGQQLKRYNMLIQKNLEQIKDRIQTKNNQSNLNFTKKIRLNVNTNTWKTKSIMAKCDRLKHQISLEVVENVTIDGYGIQKEAEEIEICEYVQRKKSLATLDKTYNHKNYF